MPSTPVRERPLRIPPKGGQAIRLESASGQPAASLPLHWTPDGLPVGVMLVGRPAGEAALLALCAQIESVAPWSERHPPIWHR